MKHVRGHGESGQATVEMGFVLTALIMMTIGLLDVGRAFYQYNALAQGVQYATRWGSVEGGTCLSLQANGIKESDWCDGLANPATTPSIPANSAYNYAFWNLAGNTPLQGSGNACPNDLGGNSSYYYMVGDYVAKSATSTTPNPGTTIIGAVAQRFDSGNNSSSSMLGKGTPGFDLAKLKACIELPDDAWSSTDNQWEPQPGDTVAVRLYYPFSAVGPLFG